MRFDPWNDVGAGRQPRLESKAGQTPAHLQIGDGNENNRVTPGRSHAFLPSACGRSIQPPPRTRSSW
jgi:hypothetical protein